MSYALAPHPVDHRRAATDASRQHELVDGNCLAPSDRRCNSDPRVRPGHLVAHSIDKCGIVTRWTFTYGGRL